MGSTAVVVEDDVQRIRRPIDLGVAVALAVVISVLLLLGVIAHATSRGLNDDVVRLVQHLPSALVQALTFLGSVGLLAFPVAYMVDLAMRRRPRRLLEGVAVGCITVGIVTAINATLSAVDQSAFYESLASAQAPTHRVGLDGYLAAVVAFATLVGAIRRRRWGAAYAAVIVVYVAAAIGAVHNTATSLVWSYLIGATIALGARYALGTTTDRPDGAAIAAALAQRGHAVSRLTRAPDMEGTRTYLAATDTGSLRVLVLDRATVPAGSTYRLYRVLRVRREVSSRPDLTLEQAAERRALLAITSAQAGAPIPRPVAGFPCGPDAIVLLYEDVAATPVTAEPPDRADLERIWRQVSRMHERSVAHGALTASNILRGPDGALSLQIPVFGTPFASNLRINVERADLLVATAVLVGPEDAVRVAHETLGDSRLLAVRPVLQPLALARENRAAARADKTLIPRLQAGLDARIEVADLPAADLERVRPRTILMLVGLIVAGYLLIGQLGSVDLATVFRGIRWGWIPAVIGFSALTYVAAAMIVTGLVRERLRFTRTVLAQLAASFVGFVAPPAVGGAATNIRYLQKSGVSPTGAATSVAVNQVLNVGAHVVLLLLVGAATGTSTSDRLPIPGWAFIAVGAIAVAGVIVFAIAPSRRWLLGKVGPVISEAGPRLLDMATRPRNLAFSVGGTLLLNASYVGALLSATYALGVSPSILTVTLVYLVGYAIGSAAPTPGGLGAVEAALSTGLAATGIVGATAVSAVLLFRLATFWLPVPVGWLAMIVLQRKGAL